MNNRKQSQQKLMLTRKQSYSTISFPSIHRKSASQIKPVSQAKDRQKSTNNQLASIKLNLYTERNINELQKLKLGTKSDFKDMIKIKLNKKHSQSISANSTVKQTQNAINNYKLQQQQQSKIQKQQQLITALCHGVYTHSLIPLYQHNPTTKREIASLTKLMTTLCSIKLAQKYLLNLASTYFRISVNASTTSGTIAELDPRQWIIIEDLLYALMLPSGNDAAVVLAENFGAFLYYQKQGEAQKLYGARSLDITNDSHSFQKLYMDNYVQYMNKMAKQLQMTETNFMNPHGLDCKQAYSTVKDLSILLSQITKNPTAYKIICTKNHKAKLKISIGKKQLQFRQVQWFNSHKLINNNKIIDNTYCGRYMGGKTGQTVGAGNCLATVYEKIVEKCSKQKSESQQQRQIYYIIVLGCSGRQQRFTDTQKIVKKYIHKYL